MPWWSGGWGPGSGPWWIFPIVMPIVFVVVMLIMLTVFREFWGHSGWWGSRRPYNDGTSADSALEILRRRFASGEITEQEYEQKRKLLLG